MSNNTLTSKRFVVRQSLLGKNTNIEVTFKSGNLPKVLRESDAVIA